MVFNAGLAGMSGEQRQTAIQAREQAAAETASQRQNQNTGITGLLAGSGQPRQARPVAGQGTRAAVVMRNIWFVNADGKLEVIRVETGVTNGSLTEIRSAGTAAAENLEGRQIILRERI